MSETRPTIRLAMNNDGGIMREVEIAPGTTVADLFKRESPAGASIADYSTRVNGRPATPDTPLNPGDRMTVATNKQAGA